MSNPIKSEIEHLRKEVNQHNHLYYVLNTPVITDAEYDALYRQLQDLEKQHPELIDTNSPTQRVGAESATADFSKVRHQHKMLSLENTFTAEEVTEFFDLGEEVLVEPKIDGASLKLIYKGGLLQQAVTRGNGEAGDDVTSNARTIRSVPLQLSEPVDIIVTGEVYMRYAVFNELNEELEAAGDAPFANARNAAAGTLKLKDPTEVSRRKLSFVVHGCNTPIDNIHTQNDLVSYLETLGFQSTYMLPIVQSCETVARTIKLTSPYNLHLLIEELDKARKCLDLPTDGLVFKINDLAKQLDLGEGTKTPNWATSYKYPPERKATQLLGVTLQVGKTGKVTPVAELSPVSLSGTIVRRASLCNADEISRLGVDVGDSVLVEKSAEIIPKVVGLAAKRVPKSTWRMPEACPCCGTKLQKPDGMVDWFCPNKLCEERVIGQLKYATSKHALDIQGCGDVMIQHLVKKANVRRLSDLLALKNLPFLKYAAKKALLEGIEKAKTQPLWRQIAALNIDGLGQTLAHEIAARVNSFEEVLSQEVVDPGLDLVKWKEFKKLLGPAVFQNILDFFENDIEEFSRLKELGMSFESKRNAGKLSGKVFVITGGLMSGTRDEVSRRIEEAGGIVKSAVTRKCSYLVAGSDTGRIKTEKATQYGVPVITEEDLYKMMGIEMPVAVDRNVEDF